MTTRLTLSGQGTAYRIAGPTTAPVVALIHGIGLDSRLWRPYAAELARGYRVLSYDLHGHGESRPSPATLSLPVLALQLRELLDEIGADRCAAVGFSLGGMINRRFAMDFPERLTALVVLNSPHERDAAAQRLVEERVRHTSRGGPQATLQSSLERWFTPDFMAARADVVNEVRSWILASDPSSYTQSRQVLATGIAELVRPSPPISRPALVMTCENDSGSTPDMARAMAAEIEGAKTIIVPKLQHLGLLEAPPLFIRPVEAFLDETLG